MVLWAFKDYMFTESTIIHLCLEKDCKNLKYIALFLESNPPECSQLMKFRPLQMSRKLRQSKG